MSSSRILLVDDEQKFTKALAKTLLDQQILVDVADDGTSGLDLALTGHYDVCVIDVMLPGISGLELIRRVRQQGHSTPMLLLTARDAITDRVAGLDSGADDYLVKPFATEELLARLRALTRRVGHVGDGKAIIVGDLRLNLITRSISHGNKPLSLTAKEFQLLELFMRHPNQVLPKALILDRVWGYDSTADLNAVEIYVHLLRKKLAHHDLGDGTVSTTIETVRGVGYKLVPSEDAL